jgi:hypothetical protein
MFFATLISAVKPKMKTRYTSGLVATIQGLWRYPVFFNGLHYPNIDDPKRRMGLSAIGRKSDCIIGVRHLNRKQTSCYKPRDLWSQQDDLPFQK